VVTNTVPVEGDIVDTTPHVVDPVGTVRGMLVVPGFPTKAAGRMVVIMLVPVDDSKVVMILWMVVWPGTRVTKGTADVISVLLSVATTVALLAAA